MVGTAEGVAPAWPDWITLAALLRSAAAAAGLWWEEATLAAAMYCFAEAMTSSAFWYCDGPVGFRARSRLAPATTPTSSVTTAATRNRSRFRRRAARMARAAARTSAGPLGGSEGTARAVRNLMARPASSAATPSASPGPCSSSPDRARRWPLPSGTGWPASRSPVPPRLGRRLPLGRPAAVAGSAVPRARSSASASARWSLPGSSAVTSTPGSGAPRARASVAYARRLPACRRLRRPPGPTARSTPVAKGLPGRPSGGGRRSGGALPGPR